MCTKGNTYTQKVTKQTGFRRCACHFLLTPNFHVSTIYYSTWKWSQRSAALAAEKLKNPGHDPGTLLLQMLTYSVKKIILSCALIAGTRNITLIALMTAWPLTVWQDPSIKIYSQLHWWWPHQTVQLFLAHYKYEVVKKDASEGPKISPIKLYL